MEPFKLTYAGVIAAGRKAFTEGRLQAQNNEPGCTYRSDEGLPCVIGSALPDEVAQALNDKGLNGCGIGGLFGVHRVNTTAFLAPVDQRELSKMKDLQSLHDCVVDDSGDEPRIQSERLEELRVALFEEPAA